MDHCAMHISKPYSNNNNNHHRRNNNINDNDRSGGDTRADSCHKSITVPSCILQYNGHVITQRRLYRPDRPVYRRLPVINIFGTTPRGQKCCLHVHGYFPYFYVHVPDEWVDKLEGNVSNAATSFLLREMGQQLERLYAAHRRQRFQSNIDGQRQQQQQHQDQDRDREEGGWKKSSNNNRAPQFIHDLLIVRGRPFYGFHTRDRLFIKLVLYNPRDVSPLAALLQSGRVCNLQFQPYEAHIPYLQQFMIDYNLFGMDYIELHRDRLWFREPVVLLPFSQMTQSPVLSSSSAASNASMRSIYSSQNIPKHQVLSNEEISRYSSSELEMDVHVDHVLNRRHLTSDEITDETENKRLRLVRSLQQIWEEERIRQKGEIKRDDITEPSSISSIRMTPTQTEMDRIMRQRLEILAQEEREQMKALRFGSDRMTDVELLIGDELGKDHHLTTLQSVPHANVAISDMTQDQFIHYSQYIQGIGSSDAQPEDKDHQLQPLEQIEQVDIDNEMVELLDWMRNNDVDPNEDGDEEDDYEDLDNVGHYPNPNNDRYIVMTQRECDDIIDATNSMEEECNEPLSDGYASDYMMDDSGEESDQEDEGYLDEETLAQLDGHYDDPCHHNSRETSIQGDTSPFRKRDELPQSLEPERTRSDNLKRVRFSDSNDLISMSQEARYSPPWTVVATPSKSALKKTMPLHAEGDSLESDMTQHIQSLSINESDFVFLRAPEGQEPYIGFVESVDRIYYDDHSSCLDIQKSTVRVHWFYRSAEVHNGREGWYGAHEIFAVHGCTDKNPMCTIIGKCEVVSMEEFTSRGFDTNDQPMDLYFCRMYYDPQRFTFGTLSKDQRLFFFGSVEHLLYSDQNREQLSSSDDGRHVKISSNVGDTVHTIVGESNSSSEEDAISPPLPSFLSPINSPSLYSEDDNGDPDMVHEDCVQLEESIGHNVPSSVAPPMSRHDDSYPLFSNESDDSVHSEPNLFSSLSDDNSEAGFFSSPSLSDAHDIDRPLVMTLVKEDENEEIGRRICSKAEGNLRSDSGMGEGDEEVLDPSRVRYSGENENSSSLDEVEDIAASEPDNTNMLNFESELSVPIDSDDPMSLLQLGQESHSVAQNTTSSKNCTAYQAPFYSRWEDYQADIPMTNTRFRGLFGRTELPKAKRKRARLGRGVWRYKVPPPTLKMLQRTFDSSTDTSKSILRTAIDSYGRVVMVKEAGNTNIKSTETVANTCTSNYHGKSQLRHTMEMRPPSPKYSESVGFLAGTNPFQSVSPSTLGSPSRVATNRMLRTPPRMCRHVTSMYSIRASMNSPRRSQISQQFSQSPFAHRNRRLFRDLTDYSEPTISSSMPQHSSIRVSVSESDNEEDDAKDKSHITVMSIELFSTSRGHLYPHPNFDPVCAICYCIFETSDYSMEDITRGVMFVEEEEEEDANGKYRHVLNEQGVLLTEFDCEEEMFRGFIDLIHLTDPDILCGYEIQKGSLGYLIERSMVLFSADDVQLLHDISRCPKHRPRRQEEFLSRDQYGKTHQSGIHVAGRIVLNLWRIMRSEVKLARYSFENVLFQVLGQRCPEYSPNALTQWWSSTRQRHIVMDHFIRRATFGVRMMHKLDVINRTSELARVFGIDFFSVLSRGSQFRVESIMLRLAKPRNYVLVSPSKKQVSSQRALECIPLVMEPESKLYSNPVVVLDFQSLYPSMIIAYNLCFSTCLGKIFSFRGKNVNAKQQLGVLSQYEIPGNSTEDADGDDELLGFFSKFSDQITITSNGVMFVKPNVRAGVLPRMLKEILETRIMTKQSMKNLDKNDSMVRTPILETS